ncbi:MAG: GNAT family N-acetyltransferase [Myxococcota bacterium]|nr:GNAT family N-acetyltransferase [Myxococcota bacterium]
MSAGSITLRETRSLPADQVTRLYDACGWSAAQRPRELLDALAGSHAVVSAWEGERLVGLGNAISDGHLVVYYPHLLVLPSHQRTGVGRRIMERLQQRYASFHQQVLLAVRDAVAFYEAQGFSAAASVEPLWIYDDADHGGAGRAARARSGRREEDGHGRDP